MAKTKQKSIKVTLIKSTHGQLEARKACVRGLGLRKLHHTVEVVDNACTRGMITKVCDMLKVEG